MDAVDAIRRILKGEKLVSVEVAFKIVENGSRHHGHVDAVLSAMRQLGFEKLVGSRHSPERDLVVAMVVARILEPQSKLATSQWWHTTTLPEILGVSDARKDDLYACAPQKVDPALIAPFRPAMLGRFVPVDSTTPPVSYESGEGPWAVLYPVLCQNSAFLK